MPYYFFIKRDESICLKLQLIMIKREIEYYLTLNLLPLPIDQRYNDSDMIKLLQKQKLIVMNIKGKIVTLRAMTSKDMSMICDMFNDPEIENLVVGWAFPISLEQQQKWFETHLYDPNNFRFVIETEEDGAVGVATLTDIDWKNRKAIHGIKLANKERRAKGIGTDTVMAIMRYAFDELLLHRLDGSWFETNIPSQRLYTKCGWQVEGIHKEYIFKRGEYRDLVFVRILESEYRDLVSRNHYWDK